MKKLEMFGAILVITTFIQLSVVQGNQILPQTKCSLEDSACLTDQSQYTLQAFLKGIPELGIPAMEKLPVDPVVASFDNFHYNWTDINVSGLKDVVFDKVSVNMELKYLRVLFHTDLVYDFLFSLDGVLLFTLPVSGGGKGELLLKNTQMDFLFPFDIIKDKTGKEYMYLKTYKYGYQVEAHLLHLENLKWDQKQSEQFHNFVNEIWRLMIFNYSDAFQSKLSVKLFDAIKIFMSSNPLEVLALYSNN